MRKHPRVSVVATSVALSLLLACRAKPIDEPARALVVPGDVNHEAFHALERARGRHLTREELLELHRVWIDDEVLFREGLKQRPAAGASREQVVFAAQRALDAQLRPPSVTDEELRQYFDAHRDRYEQPARFDFEDASRPGQASEAAVRSLVEQLNRGASLEASATLRTFQGRPESNLVQSYGAAAARALTEAEPGRWLALSAKDGWRALRLIRLSPATLGGFDAQRETIRRDFTDAALAEKRGRAVRALWSRYRIEFAEALECLADKG